MNVALILALIILALILVLIFGGAEERRKRSEYEKELERREKESRKILKEKNKKARKESRKYIDLFDNEEEQNEVIQTGITVDSKEHESATPEEINNILNEREHVEDQPDLWTENFGEPTNFVNKSKELWNEAAVWEDQEIPQEETQTNEEVNSDIHSEIEDESVIEAEQEEQHPIDTNENSVPDTPIETENNEETYEFNSDLFEDLFNKHDQDQ